MTELPAYNQLIEDAERFFQGELPPERLEATLREAEDTLDALYIQFFDGLRFQEDHPVLEEVLDPIFRAFERLSAQREPLREALAEGQAHQARELLEDGSDALHELHEQFARLREALAGREPVSRVPAVDELARVVEAFSRGALPEDALVERIRQFSEYHLALADALLSLQPSQAELGEFDPLELHAGLEAQAHGVVLLEEAIAGRDMDLLEQGLNEVLEGTGRLVYLQGRLEGATEERLRLCVRCGGENPMTARHCFHCHAQLPDMGPTGATGSFSTSEGETTEQALPANLQLLNAQVELMAAEVGDREEYTRILHWLGDNVARSRQLLIDQEPPPPGTPEDQLDALERAREEMFAGMDELESGLEVLESYLGRPDPGRLEHGMDLVRRGAEQMLRIEAIFAELSR